MTGSGSRALVIGTRGSPLARWQAEHVAALLRAAHPGLPVELSIIVTEGDRSQAAWEQSPTAAAQASKAVWVKDIELALLEGRVDLAVHSLKDVPGELTPGLALVAIPPRADPRDALVCRFYTGPSEGPVPPAVDYGEASSPSSHAIPGTLAALPPGARVGTSSLRRVCQTRALRPDLNLEILRGNVDTRLRKVSEGVVDAALLACAGLDRLGHGHRITERLEVEAMLPAIGQGALAIEARADDERVRTLTRALSDPAAEVTVAAERALLAALGGSCRTPVAGHATFIAPDRLLVRALVGRPDASEILRERSEGSPADAPALGRELARRLLARGAGRILAELG
jgi:hydroxymethylbilane synthase